MWGGTVIIEVNDDIFHYFQTLKGLRQDDLLAPILSYIVADMLATVPARTSSGLIAHVVEGEIHILQYGDATIIFM